MRKSKKLEAKKLKKKLKKLRLANATWPKNEDFCPACNHTLIQHEELGWTCDCTECPWKHFKP